MGENIAVIAAGEQIQLIFWNMGIYLPAGSRLPLAQRKTCSVSMALDLVRGNSIKGIKQTLQYGGYKTSNAEAALAGQVSFFGFPLKPLSLNLERGTIFDLNKTLAEWEDDLSGPNQPPTSHCSGSPSLSGLFSARVVSQGQRGSDSETLLLSSDMYDLRYTATLRTEACAPNVGN
jgi:hypothetical protein